MAGLVPYDRAATVRAARAVYFETNGFGADGGYDKKWVPVKVGPAEFAIKNTKGRVRSVRLHDLHHIATGYATTLEGEALVGAWELASSCRDHWAAWFLNATAFAFGIVLAPRALWRAFVRGRYSSNLYEGEFSESLLDVTVSDLRDKLRVVDEQHEASLADALVFTLWLGVGIYLLVWILALAPALLVASLIYKLTQRRLRA
ncbi:MAG TPA: hypothetical protein VGY54_10085 [Polyangiaceae bacterium]|jgi:hypothetical protein|nr:hypothetical protein [Polyangiaceae bacterium]